MSLQAILDAIFAAGEAEVRAIEERASIQAHEIEAENILEAQLAKEQAFREASSPAARERSRIIHQAHLEAMRVLGSARDELVDKAFEKIRDCLSLYRSDPNYPRVLSRLVQEALSELQGSSREATVPDRMGSILDRQSPRQDILLLADPRDHDVLENILTTIKLDLPSQFELELPIQYELECWGGVIARSADGRIVSINTLESRLERATPFLRRFLAAYFEDVYDENKLPEAGERLDVQF
jgi:vacuolar-type H+-ATPase subunit E/Vma4